MSDCRYFPECQRCNEVGDSWIPCAGGSDGTRCEDYEPMPDVDELLALADDLDSSASMLLKQNDLDPNRKRRGMRRGHAQSLMAASGRIREALGEGES